MLKLLRRIINEVETARNVDEALRIIVQYVRKSFDTEACSIFLMDKSSSELVLAATEGLKKEAIGKVRVPIGQGLIGHVAQEGTLINLSHAQTDPSFLFIPETGEEAYKAFLGVPIQHHRKILGVLVVQQKEERTFDASEESFLMTLAVQLAEIIPEIEEPELSLLDLGNVPKTFTLYGTACVSGVSIGQGVVVFQPADINSIPTKKTDDVELEIINFQQALEATRKETNVLSKRLSDSLPEHEKELFEAYGRILDSPSLTENVVKEIRTGIWAPSALKKVIKDYIRQFESMDNEYFSERADDLKDLACRILAHLQSYKYTKQDYPEHTILIGEEVTPTHLAEVPEGKLKGIISTRGSGNSHVAILARALGIPTIMGVTDLKPGVLQNQRVILDGYFGKIYVAPPQKLLKTFQILIAEENELEESLKHLKELPSETTDGHRIKLYINTGLMANIGTALTASADGVGLYRTEIPFMMRDSFPSTEEQRINYRQLLSAFAPNPVTMRILDVGGDKTLPYFPIKEPNPFLGWRGIRVMLDHSEILLSQLRAMLRASDGLRNLNIMLPMVSDISEVTATSKLLNKAYQEVLAEGLDIVKPKLGIMVEVPSAVYQSYALAKKVDFLSVGSNDLIQYLLAVDRNNDHVAHLYDPFHPAVLEALMQAVDGAHRAGKPISICGELAGHPAAAILLIAMGFDGFSMSPPTLLRIKWVIREFSMLEAKKLLNDVLEMDNGWQIRTHLEQALDKAGLGGLIRAGRN